MVERTIKTTQCSFRNNILILNMPLDRNYYVVLQCNKKLPVMTIISANGIVLSPCISVQAFLFARVMWFRNVVMSQGLACIAENKLQHYLLAEITKFFFYYLERIDSQYMCIFICFLLKGMYFLVTNKRGPVSALRRPHQHALWHYSCSNAYLCQWDIIRLHPWGWSLQDWNRLLEYCNAIS